MTYLRFHLVFMVPAIAVLALLVLLRRPRPDSRAWWSLAALSGLALTYTTGWDNYLVSRGVWSYGPDRVLGTIGWVPVEEYLFFLLQPLLTGLWLYVVLGDGAQYRREPPAPGAGHLPTAVWLVATAGGFVMLGFDATTYLGLILAWAAPVLAVQWVFAGPVLRRMGGRAVTAIALPTAYLWVADAFAIRNGIWSISSRYTTGFAPLGLPIEEATFFLLTNVLVVQGLVMFLFPRQPARDAALAT